MERIRGCLLWWKCLVACLFLEESQHPTCPHSRHKRRWTQVSPIFTHASQTCLSVDVNLISSRCVQPGIMSSEVSNSPNPISTVPPELGGRGVRKLNLRQPPRRHVSHFRSERRQRRKHLEG